MAAHLSVLLLILLSMSKKVVLVSFYDKQKNRRSVKLYLIVSLSKARRHMKYNGLCSDASLAPWSQLHYQYLK